MSLVTLEYYLLVRTRGSYFGPLVHVTVKTVVLAQGPHGKEKLSTITFINNFNKGYPIVCH